MSLEPVDERYYNRKGESNRVDTLGDQNYPNKGCMPPPINPLDDVSSGYVRVRKDEMTRRPHDCPLTEICPECLSDELEYQRFAPEGPEVVCDNCGWPDTGSAEVSNDHPEILIGILVFSLVLVASMILGFILRWWLG